VKLLFVLSTYSASYL